MGADYVYQVYTVYRGYTYNALCLQLLSKIVSEEMYKICTIGHYDEEADWWYILQIICFPKPNHIYFSGPAAVINLRRTKSRPAG